MGHSGPILHACTLLWLVARHDLQLCVSFCHDPWCAPPWSAVGGRVAREWAHVCRQCLFVQGVAWVNPGNLQDGECRGTGIMQMPTHARPHADRGRLCVRHVLSAAGPRNMAAVERGAASVLPRVCGMAGALCTWEACCVRLSACCLECVAWLEPSACGGLLCLTCSMLRSHVPVTFNGRRLARLAASLTRAPVWVRPWPRQAASQPQAAQAARDCACSAG